MSASTLKGSTLQYIYNQIKKFGKGGGGGGFKTEWLLNQLNK